MLRSTLQRWPANAVRGPSTRTRPSEIALLLTRSRTRWRQCRRFVPHHRSERWPVSAILGSVNMITTLVRLRASGMTMFRTPIFTWNHLHHQHPDLDRLPIIRHVPYSWSTGGSLTVRDRDRCLIRVVRQKRSDELFSALRGHSKPRGPLSAFAARSTPVSDRDPFEPSVIHVMYSQLLNRTTRN